MKICTEHNECIGKQILRSWTNDFIKDISTWGYILHLHVLHHSNVLHIWFSSQSMRKTKILTFFNYSREELFKWNSYPLPWQFFLLCVWNMYWLRILCWSPWFYDCSRYFCFVIIVFVFVCSLNASCLSVICSSSLKDSNWSIP